MLGLNFFLISTHYFSRELKNDKNLKFFFGFFWGFLSFDRITLKSEIKSFLAFLFVIFLNFVLHTFLVRSLFSRQKAEFVSDDYQFFFISTTKLSHQKIAKLNAGGMIEVFFSTLFFRFFFCVFPPFVLDTIFSD